MQIRLMAEITDDSGKRILAPIEIEREIPHIEELAIHRSFMRRLTDLESGKFFIQAKKIAQIAEIW